jgi:peroxiredoxin
MKRWGRGARIWGFGFWLLAGPGVAAESGETLPGFRVKGAEGGSLDNGQLKGKTTVINFWATWCEACKVELLEMEAEFKPLLDAGKVQLAMVSLDKDPSEAAGWLKKNLKDPGFGLKRLYFDPDFAMAESLGVDSFPMTFVVDGEGRILAKQKGFTKGEGSTAKLADLVRKTAGESR